jgi:predicted MFS family arabinose efflux permease
LVVGLLSASSATGQLIFLPALASLTESHGWRFALAFVCCALGLALAVVALLMRNRPGDIGLMPYGAKEAAPAAAARQSLGQMLLSPLKILREVSGSRAFWVLFATFFICGASTNGLIQTHFISLCGDYGIAPVAAASVLATMGIFDFFGTIGSGWLSDRYDSRWLLSWYYTLRGLSLVWLPFSDFSLFGLSLFSIFFGLDYIATVPPTARLTMQVFGRDRGPVVFGWIFAGHQMGAAVMAAAAGASRDALATYLPAFVVGGMASVGAGALMLLLLGPRNPAKLLPA